MPWAFFVGACRTRMIRRPRTAKHALKTPPSKPRRPDLSGYLQKILNARVYDVVLILKRARQQVSGCVVKIDAERADTEPKVFTRIHMHFTVSGKSLNEAAVARAIQLSHEKYCSASAMLAKTAQMSTGFDIVEA